MYTYQYLAMNVLHDRYSNSSRCPLQILAFPSNQFGLQEPGDNYYEIMNGLTYIRPGKGYIPHFPLLEKKDVNGENENEVYTFLKRRCPSPDGYLGEPKNLIWSPVRSNDISWNFEKFLIDHTGQPQKRYTAPVEPLELERDIQELMRACSEKTSDSVRNRIFRQSIHKV